MFNTILVSYDGSDHAKSALKVATGMAKAFDADLHLAHTPEFDTPAIVVGSFISELDRPPTAEEVGEASKKLVNEAEEIVQAAGGNTVRFHVGGISAASHTLSVAHEIHADLIVTGRRGVGAIRALALGSVSQAIAHGASCACMTVV